MAKWINFPVTGGFIAGGAAAPQQDGDNLLLAESVLSVACADVGGPGGVMTATIQMTGGLTCTVVAGQDSGAVDPTGELFPADYASQFKNAINRALTANPGGVKATVGAPQAQVAGADYDPGAKVYFKSFVVA